MGVGLAQTSSGLQVGALILGERMKRLSIATCFAIAGVLRPIPSFGTPDPAPPGKLVDVGGYRLHIRAVGLGKPTVMLIAGSGDFSFDWALVQPGVAEFTRVASYDRAGLAWSDPGPAPRTIGQNVLELHTLLQKAGLAPPYVLVGQSYGGLIARSFASSYRQEVQGIVLLDASHEDDMVFLEGKVVRIRELATSSTIPPPKQHITDTLSMPSKADLEDQWRQFGAPRIEDPFSRLPKEAQTARLWALAQPKYYAAESDPYMADELQQLYKMRDSEAQLLGDLPLMVITAGIKDYPAGLNVAPEELRMLHERNQTDLLRLSTDSEIRVARSSRHHIQLDSPDIVIDGIRSVVLAIRGKKPHNRGEHNGR